MNRITKNVKIADKDIEFVACELKAFFLKNKILKLLKRMPDDSEIKEIIDYLEHNRLSVFPYSYKSEYDINSVIARKDSENGLFYIDMDGFKLFMKRSYKNSFRARRYYNNILIEQDPRSPHCYTSDSFEPEEDSVILDIGGAEGYFPIKYLDRVKKVYIFECSPEWVEALKYTYKDYEEKVCIIDKFVADFDDESHIMIDSFVKQHGIAEEKVFIKIDAEGSEPLIIKGAQRLLNENREVSIDICTYHCAHHEKMFRKLFKDWRVENSDGYMIYYYDFLLKEPYIRRGVLRIKR